jgi:hypothetical protein
MVVTMKNAIFWDVTPCGFCKNWRSSKTLFLTRATPRNIPEDGILLYKNIKMEQVYVTI